MLVCIHGEHTQQAVQREVETGRPEATRQAGKERGQKLNYLVADAVEVYLSDQERMLADIQQAERQMDAGHYIRHQDMKAWLLSWGTDHELPLPKCVCGKNHDGEKPTRKRKGFKQFLLGKGPAFKGLDLTWDRSPARM